MDRELFEHFAKDSSHIGVPAKDAFTGAAGGAACGDVSRISLVVEDGLVTGVTTASEGCVACSAATAVAAEMAEGASILSVALIGSSELEAELGGLSPEMRHAAGLAADALHRALAQLAASDMQIAAADPETVLVAMSGGVDSAAAALIERDSGRRVVAVTLKLWADPETDGAQACCSPEAVIGARNLAHSLGVPHLTLDLEEEFRRRVVGEFLSGYAAGRTPNPCVLCNGEVRMAAMVDLAGRVGATHLVTGHYARVVDDGEGPLLASAADPAKDQAYMLAALPNSILGRVRFPLAELTKPEVRELTARAGLSVSRKPESQDLCFLAGQGKKRFLERHAGLREREGAILDRDGNGVGRHRGHHHFTVGQRRGIRVAGPEPLYVLSTDAQSNTVTVGTREELAQSTVEVRDATLARGGGRVDGVRLRYHSKLVPAHVEAVSAGTHESLTVHLHEPFDGIAPGQAAVLMSGELVVGNATIA